MLNAISRPRPATARAPGILSDVNPANLTAGLTAGLFYAFGAVPIFFGAIAGLGWSQQEASSAFFVVFMTSAVSSLLLTLRYRLPLPIGFSLPAFVFLASVAPRYSHAEIAGACLAAGIGILVLGALGLDRLILRWLPRPIVTGMFAGSLLGFVTGIFEHLQAQPETVGAALTGYLGARVVNKSWLPPVAGAVVFGVAAAAMLGEIHADTLAWQPPILTPIRPDVDAGSLLAVSLPLVVFALGLGHGQGIGFLRGQGYHPPVRVVTIVLGINSLVNAIFGGHVATIQNNGVALLGGADAGPRQHRYVANLVAASCAFALGLSAATAGTLVGVLPAGLVLALAGLALIGVLTESLQKTATTELATGAFFAFAIAASPMTLLGIGPALWAIVGGLIASLALERAALKRAWKATDEVAIEIAQDSPALRSMKPDGDRDGGTGHGRAIGTLLSAPRS